MSGLDGQMILSMDDAVPNGSGGMALAGGSAPCAGCEGDITNADGTGQDSVVDLFDLLAVIDAWGSCDQPCPPSCAEDITNATGDGVDCMFDLFDMLLVSEQWGECDSDGDGIPDHWELRYILAGADPCTPDANHDPDQDGLSNYEEYIWGTEPGVADCDEDGVLDGAEVLAGADPTEPSDNGIGPNSENVLYVMLKFGDHSCHNSETWGVRFGGRYYGFLDALNANCQEPGPDPCSNFDCEGWDCPLNAPRDKGPIPIERGEVYQIQMEWIATAYPFCDGADDNDWTCVIDLSDADGGNRQPLIEHIINDPGDEFDDEWVPGPPVDGVFIVDPAMIMGEIWNHQGGGVAFLNATKFDLVARTIDGNQPVGDLAEDQEENPGAFMPINNDDDDYDANNDPDFTQAGAIIGEDDLLPVVLKAIEPAAAGGDYSLTIPAHVRVWEGPDRTGAVNASSTFPATQDTTLYVEGIAQGTGALQINWSDGQNQLNDADRITLTTFEWMGPKNVPGYGIYFYTVAGADGMWIDPSGGSWHLSGATPSEQYIQWDSGPVIGEARYEVDDNYLWMLQVNVVHIEFGSGLNQLTVVTPPVTNPSDWRQIYSSAPPCADGRIEIDRIEGPTRGADPQSRGIKFIELGILQRVIVTDMWATFPGNNVKTWNGVGGGHLNVMLRDGNPAGAPPWYNEPNDPAGTLPGIPSYWHDPTRTTPLIGGLTIGFIDTPWITIPAQVALQGGALQWVESQYLDWQFTTFLGTRTTEAMNSNGADDEYVILAETAWSFHAEGTYTHAGANHTWNDAGSQNTSSGPFMSMTSGDTFSPTGPPWFSDIIGNSANDTVWTGGAGNIIN